MRNKKGQFYFLAIVILIAIFIGLVTVANLANLQRETNLDLIQNEISTERDWLLDYLANTETSEAAAKEILTNFSRDMINKTGTDKDVIFFIGVDPDIHAVGNRLNETNMTIVSGTTTEITTLGNFEENLTIQSSSLDLIVDNETFTFDFYQGENLFYLVKYKSNGEVHIIRG